MKVSPTREAIAGRAATRTNTRQLWNWNSVPILNPQPAYTQTHTHTYKFIYIYHYTTDTIHFKIFEKFSKIHSFHVFVTT